MVALIGWPPGGGCFEAGCDCGGGGQMVIVTKALRGVLGVDCRGWPNQQVGVGRAKRGQVSSRWCVCIEVNMVT